MGGPSKALLSQAVCGEAFNLPWEGGEEITWPQGWGVKNAGGSGRMGEALQVLPGAAGHRFLPLGLTPASATADRKLRQRD